MRSARPGLALLALFFTTALTPGGHAAEPSWDRIIYSDNDEPAWDVRSSLPMSDWVDSRALNAPDPRFGKLAERVRRGTASKPMLREFYQRWQLLYPFEAAPPPGWREREIERDRARPGRGSKHAPPGLLGAAWTSMGPSNVGGRISAIASHPSDPNLAYAGAADGGVWRWQYDPAGATWTWTPLFDDQPTLSIGSIAIDPLDPRKLYVGTGEQNYSLDEYDGVGVIRSLDGGQTWLAPVSVGGAGRIGRIAIHPQDARILFASTTRGLYKSTDSGAAWTRVIDGGYCDDVLIDPTNPSVVYAAIEGNATVPWGIYKSTTGGDSGSFAALSGAGACTLPSYPFARIALAMAPSNPAVIYAAFENNNGEVWKSTDAGLTWCQMATPGTFCGGQCWYDIVLGVDPGNPDHVLAGGVGFYRSTDGGQSWNSVGGMHVDHHAIRFTSAAPLTALIGCDGGMYRMDLSGATPVVRNVESGLITAQYYGMDFDRINAALAYGGTQDNGTQKFTAPATSTTGVALVGCGDGAAIRVHPTRNNRLFHTVCPASGDLEFLVSDNSGSSSARQVSGIQVSEGSNWVPPIEVVSASVMYTATSSRVYRSSNADAANPNQIQWTALDATQSTITIDLTPAGGSISTIAATAAAAGVVWAGTTRGMVWLTLDGVTWDEVWLARGGRNRYIGEVMASATDPLTAWVVLGGYGSFDSGGHIFETTNGGASWTDISGDLPDVPVNAIQPHPTNPDRFWAGTWLGVYETVDHGASWVFEPSVPRSAVVDMGYDQGTSTVYAATHGRGIYKVSDIATGAPPRPVPDGSYDRGQPIFAARSAGGDIAVSWGAATCSGNSDTHLFWASLLDKATFSYSGAACGLGVTGRATFTPPAGSVYFLMSGVNASGVESGHRRRDGGVGFESANGLGLCPAIAGRDVSQSCP